MVRTFMRAAVLSLLLLSVAGIAGEPAGLHALVDQLFSGDAAVRNTARDALIARGDRSIAPALVEAVFFNTHGRSETVAVLEHLLGEKHGTSFKAWIEAIGRRVDILPAPGYVGFKARHFARIDPAFAQFLREDAPRTIRVEEIIWGGVKKDGIPALDNPRFVPAREARWMVDEEPVFGVAIQGDVRAYPGRILAWHEMANDRVGGVPVSLSYCTLCGAAILYDGRSPDGRVYTFGSSGLLYRSNKLMYDRQTNTLWNQMTGEPAMGRLVGKTTRTLRVLPLTTTTWRAWRSLHPTTKVLSLDTGFKRDYRPGAAYGDYFASPGTMFPVWKKAPPSLETKEWVVVVNVDDARKIYPVDDLARRPLLHDRIAGRSVVLITDPDSGATRVYFAEERRFRRESEQLLDQSNVPFQIGEEALISETTRLHRVPAHRAYWFGAYAFYPGAELWRPNGP